MKYRKKSPEFVLLVAPTTARERLLPRVTAWPSDNKGRNCVLLCDNLYFMSINLLNDGLFSSNDTASCDVTPIEGKTFGHYDLIANENISLSS